MGDLWVNLNAASQICASDAKPEGISTQQFNQKIKPLLAPEEVRTKKRAKEYLARAVVRVWLKYRISLDVKPSESEGDPLLAGEGSDALERYRRIKAIREEWQHDKDKGSLIPRAELAGPLSRLASILRSAGERLATNYGNDAMLILVEAVDEATAEWEKLIADDEAEQIDGVPAELVRTTDQADEAPVDAPVCAG